MKRTIIIVAACLALSACERELQQQHAELFVFGTMVSLTTSKTDEETANRAFTEIGARFQQMHRDWHAWEPGELTRLNAAIAAGDSYPTSADIGDLINKSARMELASEGRFNAAAGALVALWGFHTSEYPVLGPPPADSLIDAIVQAHPSSMNIELTEESISSSNSAVQLDFGGIAKGVAVDAAIKILRSEGIPAAIVNAGGDLRAYGANGGRPWQIAVQSPGGGVLGGLQVTGDEAIFTSGNYHRFREHDTKRYAHILDPATGWPVDGVSSATVIADEGWRADAAATALIVAGPDAFAEVADSMGIDAALLIEENNVLHMTAGMAARLALHESSSWQIRVYPAENDH